MVSRRVLYFGGFVVTGLGFVAVGLLGLIDALSVLTSRTAVYGGEFVLLAMLGEAAEWVALAVILGILVGLFLLATLVSVLRDATLPRDDRVATLVGRLERRYPLLDQFDVSERVGPTVEDRRRRLKERYVDGEISEAEFEREMERLMDDESPDRETTD